MNFDHTITFFVNSTMNITFLLIFVHCVDIKNNEFLMFCIVNTKTTIKRLFFGKLGGDNAPARLKLTTDTCHTSLNTQSSHTSLRILNFVTCLILQYSYVPNFKQIIISFKTIPTQNRSINVLKEFDVVEFVRCAHFIDYAESERNEATSALFSIVSC